MAPKGRKSKNDEKKGDEKDVTKKKSKPFIRHKISFKRFI